MTTSMRWMVRSDMPRVLEIEAGCREPWSEANIRSATAKRNAIGLVIEAGCNPLGHVIFELYKSRLEVVRIAVAAEHRRCGFGTEMLARLKAKLVCNRTRIGCSVSECDLDVQLFLRACGFHAVRIDRGAGEGGEDSIRFSYAVPAVASLAQKGGVQ